MRSERHEGFTLAELLVVVAIIGIVGAVAIPLLSFQNSKKLDVAAEEVGNALRFAVSEARRTDSYILVDAKTAPGHLKVVTSDFTGADRNNDSDQVKYPPTNDPLTKRVLDIDIEGGALSGSVSMTPTFMQGGAAYKQLLIKQLQIPAGQLQLQAFDGPSANMGALESGSGICGQPHCSGIVLSLGSPSVTVTIDETTGFVAIP